MLEKVTSFKFFLVNLKGLKGYIKEVTLSHIQLIQIIGMGKAATGINSYSIKCPTYPIICNFTM